MRALVVALMVASPLIAQEPAPPVSGELAKFQGFWKPETVRYDGTEQLPKPEQRQMLTLVVKGSEYRMYVVADAAKDEHFRVLTATMTLTGPNQFDIVVKTEKAGEQKRHGIYEFRGDKLALCYAESSKPRPVSFDAGPKSEQFSEVWTREPK